MQSSDSFQLDYEKAENLTRAKATFINYRLLKTVLEKLYSKVDNWQRGQKRAGNPIGQNNEDKQQNFNWKLFRKYSNI